MRYSSEVRGEDAYFEDIPDPHLPQEMKELAHVIIERKARHFRLGEFTDPYEDAVVELIRGKKAGMQKPLSPDPKPKSARRSKGAVEDQRQGGAPARPLALAAHLCS